MPATFSVHFVDKTDVFRAVCSAWITEMSERLGLAANFEGRLEVIAGCMLCSLLEHDRQARGIRVTMPLRAPAFRALYLCEGRRQFELAMYRRNARRSRPLPREAVVATLLVVERLCDVRANDEVEALG
jgi:hypothetical protein